MNSEHDIIFYDGHCALCHGLVKFLLAQDKTGNLFKFAPLQGETFKVHKENIGTSLPDSVVVLAKDGKIYFRSSAIVYLLSRLSGAFSLVAFLLKIIPKPLRDFGYDSIARVRKRIFGTKEDLCPIMPAELRNRFLL